MQRKIIPWPLLAHGMLALALAALPAAPLAQTGDAGRKGGKAPKRSNQIKVQNTRSSSEESAAERDRRLYRECQGRPNSGACAGYTGKPAGGRQR